MPNYTVELEIPPVSSGIGEARRFTRERLSVWGLDGVADPAILMISELVTNAILHGGEGAVLKLAMGNLKLRVEVRDASTAMPVVRGYSETATTGRGMIIVDALASSWGTFPVEGGKVVWFELATDVSLPQSPAAVENPVPKPATRGTVSEIKRGRKVAGGEGGSAGSGGRFRRLAASCIRR